MPTYIVPDEILAKSPSRRAGVPASVEESNRVYGCELIVQAGLLLRLKQPTVTTAQILLHRFYYRGSMVHFQVLYVVMGAVFLATKIEEDARRVRDIVNVLDRVIKLRYRAKDASGPPSLLDRASPRYNKWSRRLTEMELVMLKELGYTVYVDHPHRFILFYVRTLSGGALSAASKLLAQKAWNVLNDAMRLDVCVRFRPEVIATAAIHLASRLLAVRLPQSPPWWRLFGATRAQIDEVAAAVAGLYVQGRVEYTAVSEEDKRCFIILSRERYVQRSADQKAQAPAAAGSVGGVGVGGAAAARRAKDETSKGKRVVERHDKHERRKRRRRTSSRSSSREGGSRRHARRRRRRRNSRSRSRERDRRRGSRRGSGRGRDRGR